MRERRSAGDSPRGMQFANRKKDLDTKYRGLHTSPAGAHPFAINLSSTAHPQWREAIARYFSERFVPLQGEAPR